MNFLEQTDILKRPRKLQNEEKKKKEKENKCKQEEESTFKDKAKPWRNAIVAGLMYNTCIKGTNFFDNVRISKIELVHNDLPKESERIRKNSQ